MTTQGTAKPSDARRLQSRTISWVRHGPRRDQSVQLGRKVLWVAPASCSPQACSSSSERMGSRRRHRGAQSGEPAAPGCSRRCPGCRLRRYRHEDVRLAYLFRKTSGAVTQRVSQRQVLSDCNGRRDHERHQHDSMQKHSFHGRKMLEPGSDGTLQCVV